MASTTEAVGADSTAGPTGSAAGRNLVIFSDGTGQDGGLRPEQRMSNVYKLYRACRVSPDNDIDPTQQVVFYDPGLGTDASATGFTAIRRTISKVLASATGRGITTNIADCYEFLINHYREGDRIFLFGFSRGAYTIRSLANVLWLCGIPTRCPAGDLPRFRNGVRDIADEAVLKVYEHGAGHPRAEYEEERLELARRFRAKYSSGDSSCSNAAPYFIGAFDTVASLGAKGAFRLFLNLLIVAAMVAGALAIAALLHLFFDIDFRLAAFVGGAAMALYVASRRLKRMLKVMRDPPGKPGRLSWHLAQWSGKNFDRLLSGRVGYARHAIAIDENRDDFPRLGWGHSKFVRSRGEGEPEPLVQLWFAGNHSDIGGSYPEEESRLSDIALQWMVDETQSMPHRLLISRRRLHAFPAADGLQHDEVANMNDVICRRTPRFLLWATRGLSWKKRIRDPKPNSPMHPSVDERFAMASVPFQGGSGPYRPEALRNHERYKHLY
jgi:uncharacterized protein (DUF2235 family)